MCSFSGLTSTTTVVRLLSPLTPFAWLKPVHDALRSLDFRPRIHRPLLRSRLSFDRPNTGHSLDTAAYQDLLHDPEMFQSLTEDQRRVLQDAEELVRNQCGSGRIWPLGHGY